MLKISGIVLYTRVGMTEEERRREREILVDVSIESEEFVDLKDVYQLVRSNIEHSTYRLIEEIAEVILAILRDKFSPEKLIVEVRKPNPPIGGRVDFISFRKTYEG